MPWNPFSASDWESLGGSMGSAFSEFGNIMGSGFTSGFNYVVEGGTIVQGQIGSGALVVIRATTGALDYAIDFTKVTASSSQQWVTTASGDVGDFSIQAYNEGKKLGEAVWKVLSSPATPPVLGPPDPVARECMSYLLSPPAVSMWERDATLKGYTIAFDFRATAALPPISQTAFSGIYVDSAGQWGFIGQTGTGVTASFNVNLEMEFWMVFGDRNDFQAPCYMPGIGVSVELPSGLSVTGGITILVRPNGTFKGFRFRQGVALMPSEVTVAPDAGPPASSLTCYALSEKAPSYSAASKAVRDEGTEPTLLATAVTNTMPFIRRPESFYFIQCKNSGKVWEVCDGSSGDGAQIQQASFTGGRSQRFRFENRNNGAFMIIPHVGINPQVGVAHSKVLDIAGEAHHDGALVIQYSRKDQDNQMFQVTSHDDGYFGITPRHSGKALQIHGESKDDGARVAQWHWHGGDHFEFRFIEVHEQPDWRWCKKCYALWFSKTTVGSHCAAGGAHDATGSFPYFLIYAGSESYGALHQDRWRWCHKCSSLFFGGNTGSKCPKDGGEHDARYSYNYVMAVGTSVADKLQADWSWCHKCQGLYSSGSGAGVCPAGGGHENTHSYKYRLLTA
jgi:hypothetical protein